MNPFLIISSLLPLVSATLYIRSILWGTTRPHRTTRFVLLSIGILSTLSLYIEGDRVAFWLSFTSLLQSIIVFALCIHYGMGGWSKSDLACLCIAIFGIISWKTTNDPFYGLLFAVIADFSGMIPTLLKAYRRPETEYWPYAAIDSVAGLLNLLALHTYRIESMLYPLYIFAVNALMVIFIILGKRKNTSPR